MKTLTSIIESVLFVSGEAVAIKDIAADDKRMLFAAATAAIVVLSPAVIRVLFNTLSNILG